MDCSFGSTWRLVSFRTCVAETIHNERVPGHRHFQIQAEGTDRKRLSCKQDRCRNRSLERYWAGVTKVVRREGTTFYW
jgi:hypothetical protein